MRKSKSFEFPNKTGTPANESSSKGELSRQLSMISISGAGGTRRERSNNEERKKSTSPVGVMKNGKFKARDVPKSLYVRPAELERIPQARNQRIAFDNKENIVPKKPNTPLANDGHPGSKGH